MRRFLTLYVCVISFLLVASACSTGSGRGNEGGITIDGEEVDSKEGTIDGEEVTIDGNDVLLTSHMIQFNDCDALLEHLRTEAVSHVGADIFSDYVNKDYIDTMDLVVDDIDTVEADQPQAIDDSDVAVQISADRSSESGSILSEDSPAKGIPVSSSSAGANPAEDSPIKESYESTSSNLRTDFQYSETNIQKLDVDEADVIKMNGKYIFAIINNYVENDRLVVVDIASRTVTGSIKIANGQSAEMFLLDHSLLLIQKVKIEGVGKFRGMYNDASKGLTPSPTSISGTVIQRIEVRDGIPEVVSTLRVEGGYLTSRSVNGIVRVMLRSKPQWKFPFVFPKTNAAKAAAEKANRRAILESTLDDWLPAYDLNDSGWQSFSDCQNVHVPSQFSGFGVMTMLTLPVDGEIVPDMATAVLTPGGVLYASTTSFYTTSTAWTPIPPQTDDNIEDSINDVSEQTTSIHQFDIIGGDEVIYVASGEVSGSGLGWFSTSKYDGHLRVVTTTRSPQTGDEERQVRVLRKEGKRLVEVGHVGNIGQGAYVLSVRFVGDIGFVVSFRRSDTIDTIDMIDLSDPTQPIIRGELEIPVFSRYLHSRDNNYVLGVGEGIDVIGRRAGTKVSLFNISNLNYPHEVAAWTEPDSPDLVRWDESKVLWWAPKNLLIIPLDNEGIVAVVLKVSDGTITEVGRIQQMYTGEGNLRRTRIIGSEIWTFNSTWTDDLRYSESLLQVNDLNTLEYLDTVYLR